MGTVGYMSPEQATGGEVDFRSDQFSFGSVIFEMVTGFSAFRKKTHAETMAAILRDEPERSVPDCRRHLLPSSGLWNDAWPRTRNSAMPRHGIWRATLPRCATIGGCSSRRVPDARPNNLPVQRTALVGREHEATALRQLLSRTDVQLITLTGPGGIGKTRLALQVAAETGLEFPGGVCFVPLSAVSDRSLDALPPLPRRWAWRTPAIGRPSKT